LGRVDPRLVGEHGVPLSPEGETQAQAVGHTIGAEFLRDALVYHSPYLRARQTLDGIVAGAGLSDGALATHRRYEDPRLREVDHGYDPVAPQDELRKTHGWFYYR